MRVIKLKTLRDYWEQHPEVQGPLEAWYEHVKRAHWKTPADVTGDYRTVSILSNNRAVFNLKTNEYRLVVHFHYKFETVYIRFIGTHAQYDRIDATRI
jgi:mRNA interferase HigB